MVEYYYRKDGKRIKQLAPLWESVDISGAPLHEARRWTEAGFDCLEIQRACAICPFAKMYGKSWQNLDEKKRCFQPVAVQQLLNEGVGNGLSGMYLGHKN